MIDDMSDEIDSIRESMIEMNSNIDDIYNTNLLDGIIVNKGFYQHKDGNQYEIDGNTATDYIEVLNNTVYKAYDVDLRYSRSIYAYTPDKKYIGSIIDGTDETDVEFTTPSNCCFIRLCYKDSANPKLRLADNIINKEIDKLNYSIKIIEELNCKNILTDFCDFSPVTHNGVSFDWLNKNTCKVVGKPSSEARDNLYLNSDKVPECLNVGDTYDLVIDSTSPKVLVQYGWCINSAWTTYNSSVSTSFTLPSNADGFLIRPIVYDTYDGSGETISVILKDCKTNKELDSELKKIDSKIENVDILAECGKFNNYNINGVQYNWSDNNTKITAIGTSTGGDLAVINSKTKLPMGLDAGSFIFITANITDVNIKPYIGICINGEISYRTYITEDTLIYIPKNCSGIVFNISVFSGKQANGYINNLHIYKNNTMKPLINSFMGMENKNRVFISFTDDDTVDDESVTRYYKSCVKNGIVGTYAVILSSIDNKYVDVEKLLQYEDEGFGMFIHCYNQDSSFWHDGTLTENELELCKKDLGKGLRKMSQLGFRDFQYWVVPNGKYDDQMQHLARMFGMKALINITQNNNYITDRSKYNVQRVSFAPNDDNDASSIDHCKKAIDEIVKRGSGWIDFNTHFATWKDVVAWDDTNETYNRFDELVEYAKSKGCEIVPFKEAFSYWFE